MERVTSKQGFEEINHAVRRGERYIDIDIEFFSKVYNKLYEMENDIERIVATSGNIANAAEETKIIDKSKILLVEDGSVDVEKLEQDGFYVIIYRQNSRKPEWLDKE